MRWTNDKWVSTVHRVVNPPEEIRHNVDRMSVAFFFVPDHDVEVSCIDSCTGPGQSAALSDRDRRRALAREDSGGPADHRQGELVHETQAMDARRFR